MVGGKSFDCSKSESIIQKNADLLRFLFSDEYEWTEDDSYICPSCPVCCSDNIRRNGHTTLGQQRFQCIDCKKTFTEQYRISRLKYTKLTMDIWCKFLECQVSGLSVRDSAKICGVSIPTAYRMRSCILSIIDDFNED